MARSNECVFQPRKWPQIGQTVEGAGTKAGPGLLNRHLSQRGNQPSSKIGQISNCVLGRSFIKADFFFGRASQHAAIISWNQVPRSFVGNSRDGWLLVV